MTQPKEIHLTQEQLKDKFDYDPITGVLSFTTNLCNRYNAYKGKRAGYVRKTYTSKRPYRVVGLDKHQRKIYEHRLIWKWYYGEEPPHMINHINQNGLDNRIENLEASTNSENQRNAKLRSDNTLGEANIYNNKKKKLLYASVIVNKQAYRAPSRSYKNRPFKEVLEECKLDRDLLYMEHGFSKFHGKKNKYDS
jgi:hypothetical protein